MNERSETILSLKNQLAEALKRNRLLQEELAATNSGLLALTLELEAKNEEVQVITQQLGQVSRMATMGELAASIAHELNNPLTTVSLRVESLSAQISADDLKQRSLQIIFQEIERMSTLIKNLLDFSRRGQRQVSTVDVCRELEHTLELIYYLFRKKRITIKRAYQSELPKINADSQGLQQVFINLFTNACDAMPQGGTLTIRVFIDPIDSEYIAIEFSDTGIGIQPEALSKVMDPFFTTKLKNKGTGLGLAICRRIMQEHHGLINITSEIGKGTTVSLKLPL
ncbi:sensor histidine kinase [Desulfotomaculum sp. 1211_IL3151]|uniref:sensor histidine kinase n=1 Tax=Desulfotomaculum sp. 1211_IL3151 TaxID=3084055 RepID=UPI002FD90681